MKKIAAYILMLFLCASFGQVECAKAEGRDRGIMRVTFLYAIEYTGGRGEVLRSPMDMCFDRKTGELYIADAGHGAIFVYDNNGMYLDKIPVTSKEGSPTMVAVDNQGRLFVGHNNSPKISVMDFRGTPLEVLVLPGVIDVAGSNVRPLYLAGNQQDGQVYALKSSGGLVRIDPHGLAHEEIVITGGEADDMPHSIFGFSIDQDGRFLFSDMRPYSIVRFDRQVGAFQRFGSPGILYGQIARPAGIATDDAGHIFATSTVRNKVLAYDQDGNFVEEFGGIGKGYGRFYMPSKIVSDGKDRLYVLETPLKRVQVFDVQFRSETNERANQNP